MEALSHVSQGDYRGHYVQDRATGEYAPLGWQPDYADYFKI
jgi:hypothetical protein